MWLNVAPSNELSIGERKVVEHDGTSIIVFNVDGKYYAVINNCTHEHLPLEDGPVDGTSVTCPFHGAEFCLKTGKVLAAPAFEDLQVFPTRVENDLIQVNV